MTKYEVLYIVSPTLNDEQKDVLINKFKEYLEKNNAVVSSVEKMGLKKLAYPIKFKSEGFYVLMTYEADPEVSNSMAKLMLITDGILRSLVVKK